MWTSPVVAHGTVKTQHSSNKQSKQRRRLAFVVWFSFLRLLWAVLRLQIGCRNPSLSGLTLAEPPTWTKQWNHSSSTHAVIVTENVKHLDRTLLTILIFLNNFHVVSSVQINFMFGRLCVVCNRSVHVQNDGARNLWVDKHSDLFSSIVIVIFSVLTHKCKFANFVKTFKKTLTRCVASWQLCGHCGHLSSFHSEQETIFIFPLFYSTTHHAGFNGTMHSGRMLDFKC